MKVLWFSNGILSKETSTGSGSWLHAMRDLISSEVSLVNITECRTDVSAIECHNGNGIKEYLLPQWKLHNGVPSDENIQKINSILIEEQPDLIHIWGIEKYWALLFGRNLIPFDKVLLEMQGVAASVMDVYYGGLTPKECKKIKRIKSFLFPKQRLTALYSEAVENAKREVEIVSNFKSIATQSDWTREQLSSICEENTKYFYSLRPIRSEFYKSAKWEDPINEHPVIYSSFSYYAPFKGTHILLKALSLLKRKYPGIVLNIAGPSFYGLPFYKGMDYGKYLSRLIDQLSLKDNIHFCGSLNASQITKEILHADVVINPSFVESYSAAAAEALYLGAPTVLAYAGAMVNFSNDCPVALYYNPMDYRSLASNTEELLVNSRKRDEFSSNAIKVMTHKADPERVKITQINTYESVMLEK